MVEVVPDVFSFHQFNVNIYPYICVNILFCVCHISVVYAHESLSQQLQPIESCILLKTFLLLWKRLEVLKQQWIQSKLGVSSIQTHAQYVTYWLVFSFSNSFYFAFKLLYFVSH